MMSEIVEELAIEAIPESVFYALTRPGGIAGWWSNHVVLKLYLEIGKDTPYLY